MIVAQGPLWLGRTAVTAIRWWFGVVYFVGGVGAVIAGPIMIGLRDYGGLYMILGGAPMAVVGWLIHPWGLQRAVARG